MKELQDKIMEYLCKQMVVGNHDAEIQAKDIVEIFESHCNLCYEAHADKSNKIITELKEQYLQHDIEMCKINKEADNRIIELEKENETLNNENIRLTDEVNHLDNGIHKHKDPHWKMFQDIQIHLEKQITELKKQLVEVKTLNRQEVEKILKTIEHQITSYPGKDYVFTSDNFDKFISTICSLAIKIDKDKIVNAIKKYITIDYDNIPIRRDLGGIDIYEMIADEILEVK